jgi:hypothetical protein
MNNEPSHAQHSQEQQGHVDPESVAESEPFPQTQEQRVDPTYKTTERVFRLLHLLLANECTRQEIFDHLREFYHTEEGHDATLHLSSQRAGRMLLRDLKFLEKMGYTVSTSQDRGPARRYRLAKAADPHTLLLFTQPELDALILLHTIFADPTAFTPDDATFPFPPPGPRAPFAEDIVAFIERLVAMLPTEHKSYFDQWARKPFVYFNLHAVTDYLPHRETINTLVQAISWHRQIRFDYAPQRLFQETVPHEMVDPYYIIFQDGHLYLVAFSHKMNCFYEYRIDRIVKDSVRPLNTRIDGERRRHPIEFRYWAYGNLAKGGGSQRWLSQTIEREEVYVEGKRLTQKALIRAQDYSDFRILRQLHGYADKVELVDPPHLRDKMSKEVQRTAEHYKENEGEN